MYFFIVGQTNGQSKNWDFIGNKEFGITEVKDTITLSQVKEGYRLENLLNPFFEIELKKENDTIFIDGDNITIGSMIKSIQGVKTMTISEMVNKVDLILRFNRAKLLESDDEYKNGALYDLTYPIHDAYLLRNTKDLSTIKSTLKKYEINAAAPNGFLIDFIDSVKIGHNINASQFASTIKTTDNKSILSSIGGLDVTKYADGLAKFLVKRTKQELSTAFFTKFKTILTDEKNKDLQDLFPQTHNTLILIGNEIYEYQRYITTLREQFENDLKKLPDNFPKIIGNNQTYFNKYPGLEAFVNTGSQFARSLRDKEHPGTALANIQAQNLIKLDSNLTASVQMLQLFSEALRDTIVQNHERYWVNSKTVQKVINDPVTTKIFLGLILEKIRKDSIQFNGKYLYNSLNHQASNYQPYYHRVKKYITNLSENIQRIDMLLNAEKNTEDKSITFEDLLTYFSASIDLMENMVDIDSILPRNLFIGEKSKDEVKNYVKFVSSSTDLILNVNHKKYGAAIINLVTLYKLSTIHDKSDSTALKSKLLMKYGTFIATITQAEDSDEIAAAIEAYALPSGSSRIKRESKFNFSLNAYVGIYGGYEKSRLTKPDTSEFSWGVTAPIGLAISYGGWCKGKDNKRGGKSISAFFSLIDIGALTAFRFNNDTTDVPNIYLKEIISPGAFLSLGLGKVPISLNAGYQISPRLRRVGANENEVNLEYHGRWSASIAVDIPLTNFYTKPKE